jgi:hypothetical protein
MEMNFKENVILFFWVILSTVIYTVQIPLFIILGIIGLFVGAAIVGFTISAVEDYANVISYPGMALVSFFGAWLFAKAREAKPRWTFDWLARAGFWYSMVILLAHAVAAILWLIKLTLPA